MVDRRGAASGVEIIMRATVHKWQRLREDLERFVSKHEYRNAEPITESEAASWRVASEILAGRPHLFSNQMRRDGGEPRRVDARQDDAVQTEAPSDFAFRKLELRVRELTQQLNEASTRASAADLRAENDRLRAELAKARAEATSRAKGR
jgi:hypothetical protein